jgi:hypothetical protein
MLRNVASGPEIGLPACISAGSWSGKPQNVFSGSGGHPEYNPAEIRPGNPIFGPEAVLRNIQYIGHGLASLQAQIQPKVEDPRPDP